MRWTNVWRARSVLLAAVLVGCSAPGAEPVDAGSPPAPVAALTASIPAGAQDVAPADPLVITAVDGTLTSVTASTVDGGTLPGELDPTGTRWTSAPLAWGRAYRVQASGRSADGAAAAALTSTFTTRTRPAETVQVERVRPEPGAVVGVAMPVSIYFNRPVTDRAAVERRLAVLASVPTEGSFHWFDDDRVHWRPSA